MRVKVRLARRQGVALHRQLELAQPPVVGELEVTEHRDPALGRAVTLARLVNDKDRGVEVLPPLYDARLLWSHEQRMHPTGFERIDEAAYAQTLTVEVVSC